MIFSEEYEILEEIAAEPKTKLKLEILKKNKKALREVVLYALDFTKKYNIKKFPLPGMGFKQRGNRSCIFEYLDYLSSKRGTSNEEVRRLAEMCHDETDIEVIRRIVNKDLRCGVNLKTASKVFKELPTKDIMLCGKAARVIIKKGKKKPKISSELYEFVEECGGWDNIGISEKENGVRDKISVVNGKVSHLSRNGLAYNNFTIFDESILYLAKEIREITGEKSTILDGEVVSIDEDFQKQMTQIRRLENVDPSIFELRIFDIPSLTSYTQEKRERILKKAYDKLPKKFQRKVKLTLCIKVTNLQEFFYLYKDVTVTRKKEGVVLKNLSGKYENKRSNYWCKVKTFYSEDLKVIGVEKGKPGKKYAKTLGALVVYFNGIKVSVGSGYTDEERGAFLIKPPKMIEVEYKEITKDGSLFHPSFSRVREDR